MGRAKGFRRKTKGLLKAEKREGRGLSRLMVDYKPQDRVVIDVDPRQPKGMPHRRFQGLVGVIKKVRRRSIIVDVPVGNKVKSVIARLEHVKRHG